MPNQCEKIRQEYKKLKDLKQEFDLEFEKALATGKLARAKELKAILEQKRDALEEILWTPSLVKKSMKRIKEELNLDIQFDVDDKGEIKFRDADDKINQLTAILVHRKNKARFIDLQSNSIKAAGAKEIAEALKHENNKVESLDLRHNTIEAAGAKEIAEALKHENNKVESLNLWGNSIKADGAKEIAEALKHKNNKVESLNLESNSIEAAGAKEIAEALKHENNKVESLNLGSNSIKDEKIIQDTVKDIESKTGRAIMLGI